MVVGALEISAGECVILECVIWKTFANHHRAKSWSRLSISGHSLSSERSSLLQTMGSKIESIHSAYCQISQNLMWAVTFFYNGASFQLEAEFCNLVSQMHQRYGWYGLNRMKRFEIYVKLLWCLAFVDWFYRLCNEQIVQKVQQVICFAFHDSNLLLETCREAKHLRKMVTLFYLDWSLDGYWLDGLLECARALSGWMPSHKAVLQLKMWQWWFILQSVHAVIGIVLCSSSY